VLLGRVQDGTVPGRRLLRPDAPVWNGPARDDQRGVPAADARHHREDEPAHGVPVGRLHPEPDGEAHRGDRHGPSHDRAGPDSRANEERAETDASRAVRAGVGERR